MLCEYPAGGHHGAAPKRARCRKGPLQDEGSLQMRRMGCLGAIALCRARLCIAHDPTATPAAHISRPTVIVRAGSLIDGTSTRPLRSPRVVILGTRALDGSTAGADPAAPTGRAV